MQKTLRLKEAWAYKAAWGVSLQGGMGREEVHTYLNSPGFEYWWRQPLWWTLPLSLANLDDTFLNKDISSTTFIASSTQPPIKRSLQVNYKRNI